MFSKSFILLALTSFALAIPQDAVDSSETDSTNTAEFADVNDLLAALANVPTLPLSAQEALATVIPDPEADLTSAAVQCNPSAASWFGDLSTDVQTALTTYVDAVQSWVVAHPDIVENYAASLPDGFALCEDKGETTSTSSGVATTTGLTTSTASTSSSATISSGPLTNSSSTTVITASPTPTLFSTSTIYATLTSTISSCAPTVTNCPYGSVTTITTAISTTVCPITDILNPTGSFTISISGVASGTAAGPTSSPAPFKGAASRVSGTIGAGFAGILGALSVVVLF